MQLTSDGGAGRPGGDGVSSLVEEDVGSTCAHLRLWNRLGSAVIVAVPLAVNRVPAEGCKSQNNKETYMKKVLAHIPKRLPDIS